MNVKDRQGILIDLNTGRDTETLYLGENYVLFMGFGEVTLFNKAHYWKQLQLYINDPCNYTETWRPNLDAIIRCAMYAIDHLHNIWS